MSYRGPTIRSLPLVTLEGNEYEPYNPYGSGTIKKRPWVVIQDIGTGEVEISAQPPCDLIRLGHKVNFKVSQEMFDLLAQAIFTYQSACTERATKCSPT